MKVLTTLILSLSLTCLLMAEYPENPDKFTSMSLMAGYEGGSGEYELTDDFGDQISQDLSPSRLGFSALITAPVSNNMSMLIEGSYSSQKTEGERTNYFYESKSAYTTFSISFGFKIYMK